MKITIATGPIFPVPTVRGGAAQRVWEGLLPEFVKRGHEVTVFAREFPGQPKEETIMGIRYVRRGGYAQSISIKRDLVQCLIYALKVSRHVPSGDVVVTNDFWMPAVLPWLNAKAGRVIASIARFPKGQFFLYKKCASIAPVSGSVARGIREQTPAIAGKITVVPNCVDAAFLRETKSRVFETARGVAEGKPRDKATKRLKDGGDAGQPVRILYVGRIHPEKGLELLADALRLLAGRDQKTNRPKDEESEPAKADGDSVSPVGAGRGQTKDWECVLVGPVKESEGGGGEAFAGELQRQINGLPVRFEPPVYDPAALAEIYDKADVFVYPSVAETGESFGIAPLEAMARGVVPVVSDLAVFRDYLKPRVNGMVFDHRSSDAAANLATVLRELIQNPDRREQLGTAARGTAEHFSPSAIADKYLQLFEKVVSGT